MRMRRAARQTGGRTARGSCCSHSHLSLSEAMVSANGSSIFLMEPQVNFSCRTRLLAS